MPPSKLRMDALQSVQHVKPHGRLGSFTHGIRIWLGGPLQYGKESWKVNKKNVRKDEDHKEKLE